MIVSGKLVKTIDKVWRKKRRKKSEYLIASRKYIKIIDRIQIKKRKRKEIGIFDYVGMQRANE